jgi:hypothetical protein
MQETSIVQGKIEVKGLAHGAMNALVTYYQHPQDWEFVQFHSQEELEQYALDHHLVIHRGES